MNNSLLKILYPLSKNNKRIDLKDKRMEKYKYNRGLKKLKDYI